MKPLAGKLTILRPGPRWQRYVYAYMDVYTSLAGSSMDSVVAIAGNMVLGIPLSSTEMGEYKKSGQTAARSFLGNVRSGHNKDIKHLEYCELRAFDRREKKPNIESRSVITKFSAV